MIARILVSVLVVGSMSLAGACERKPGADGKATAVEGRCPHDIKQETCPFCNPGLIESDGFCGEHGVAEALCAECRPYLKAAFRAKGDWCKTHETPDSQCITCHPELKEKTRPGEHGVPSAEPGKGGSQ